MPEPIWRPSTRARQLVNVRFPCFRFCVSLPGMVWSVNNGIASAWPSGSTGSDLWESNEEDALGSVGRELLELPAISAIVHGKVIDFSYRDGRVVIFPREIHARSLAGKLWSYIQVGHGCRSYYTEFRRGSKKSFQSGAVRPCLVRFLASEETRGFGTPYNLDNFSLRDFVSTQILVLHISRCNCASLALSVTKLCHDSDGPFLLLKVGLVFRYGNMTSCTSPGDVCQSKSFWKFLGYRTWAQ